LALVEFPYLDSKHHFLRGAGDDCYEAMQPRFSRKKVMFSSVYTPVEVGESIPFRAMKK